MELYMASFYISTLRLVTNDPVYSVLSDEKPLYMKLSLFLLIKFLLLFSNILGWYLIKFI